MKKCIYCQCELTQLRSPHTNYYFCVPCFQEHLIAVLYSYDSWGDRYTSIYLDYYSSNEHIRVGIQPYLDNYHVVCYPNKFLSDKDKLLINIEGGAMHVMMHPHANLTGIVTLKFPIHTILTPTNIQDKISTYLLFS